MTPQQIKDQAPDGATFYLDLGGAITYLHYEHGCCFYYNNGGWYIYRGTFGPKGKIPLN